MTYTFTHLTLQGLIVWLLLSKENKEYYKNHRWEFILVNIFAMLPDIDLLFGAHRTYTHSLIPPAFFLLSLIILSMVDNKMNMFDDRSKRIIRFFKLASIMWMFHIIFDLGWYSIMLFWPIDTNFYDLTVFFRFETEPWLFVPLTFVGIIPNWRIYPRSDSGGFFITDLSQEARKELFGQYWDFTIEQISVHFVILLTWFIVILLPAFKRKRSEKTENVNTAKGFAKIIWRKITRQLTLIGIFLIALGLLLGPLIGKERNMQYSISSEYINTQSYFDPTLGFTFQHYPEADSILEYKSEHSVVPYNSTILLTNNDTFYNFFTSLTNLTANYYDANITYSKLIENYNDLVNITLEESYLIEKLVHEENIEGFSISLNATEERVDIYFISMVSEWNVNDSFVYESSVILLYTFDRSHAQISGLVLDLVGVLVIIVDQILDIPKRKREEEN